MKEELDVAICLGYLELGLVFFHSGLPWAEGLKPINCWFIFGVRIVDWPIPFALDFRLDLGSFGPNK